MTAIEGLNLLADVSQPGTQWSIVYDMTNGEVQVIMGRNYAGKVHVLKLNR
jgi:ABC-type hemin transport system ATPase subunit